MASSDAMKTLPALSNDLPDVIKAFQNTFKACNTIN